MHKSYIATVYNDFTAIINNFSWQSELTKKSLKTSFIIIVSLIVTCYADIPQLYWTATGVIIVMSTDSFGTSLQKGLMRIGGACLGSFSGMVIGYYCAANPLLFSIVIFCIGVLGFYMSLRCKLSYLWFGLAVHAIIFIMMSAINQTTEPYNAVFYRSFCTTVGVGITWLAIFLLQPVYTYQNLITKSKNLQKDFASFIDK